MFEGTDVGHSHPMAGVVEQVRPCLFGLHAYPVAEEQSSLYVAYVSNLTFRN